MYPGTEFSELEMKGAIRDHRTLIDAYYELGCDEDDDPDDDWDPYDC